MDRRRVILYGSSVILGALRISLGAATIWRSFPYPHHYREPRN